MTLRKPLFSLSFLLLTVAGIPAFASDLSDSGSSSNCVALFRIDNVKIIDSRNIVVKTKNNEYYLNNLPHTCPGLDERKAIMYKTATNKLCNLDIITVLDYIGGGYKTVGSCGLGKFKQVTEDELKFIKDGSL